MDWKSKVLSLFPEYVNPGSTIEARFFSFHGVFHRLEWDVDEKISASDTGWLNRVFELVESSFDQGGDTWNTAATAFLEHMADEDQRSALIPDYVKPALFEDMWEEFKKRRERNGLGKAKELLLAYNTKRGTDYSF